MQELRIVAVSEDGSYAVLAVPGRGGRFSLPIDDRLRIVARGQFSRLAQYEIEVESPLRPKEIQDRIRAGETAEEIADAAGVPIERVRRFEGPVLAERAYRAQEAQGASIRQPGDSGPGPRLGDIVAERLAELGVPAEEAQWDSRKRGDNNWQVQLMFTIGGRPLMAEWVFDPRRRHVTPADDDAARLSLPEADLAALAPVSPGPGPGYRHSHRQPARGRGAACPRAGGRPRGAAAEPEPAVSQARDRGSPPGPRPRKPTRPAPRRHRRRGRRGTLTTRRRGPLTARRGSPPGPRRGGPPGGRSRGDSARGREPGAARAAARPGPQGRRRPVPPLVRAVLG